MLKRYILVTALTISSITVFASKPTDSIGVENNNGKKLIVHKVDAKDSYYSISRKYNANVKDVQSFNNNIALQIGGIVKVPTEVPFIATQVQTVPVKTNNGGYFEYTVVAKDNLNAIAERYATSSAEIIKLNGLTTINLKLGQVLKVPFVKSSTNKGTNASVPQTTVNNPVTPPSNTSNATEHVVKPKEYLGVIAKQYGITVEELKAANGLTGNNLSIGQTLKIPTTSTNPIAATNVPATKPVVPAEVKAVVKEDKKPEVKTQESQAKAESSFEHTVSAGETIYSIAQKYKLTTYQLKNSANLTSNDLTVGQKLTIKGDRSVQEAARDNTENNSIDSASLKSPSLRRPASVYGLNRVEEKGTGVWISDADLDPNKMLILHRTAPVGTIIQITNPMTSRSTFAKVVGKFTENETTKDVIIVMTKAVADAIGALDKRFFCNLTYGPKENEK